MLVAGSYGQPINERSSLQIKDQCIRDSPNAPLPGTVALRARAGRRRVASTVMMLLDTNTRLCFFKGRDHVAKRRLVMLPQQLRWPINHGNVAAITLAIDVICSLSTSFAGLLHAGPQASGPTSNLHQASRVNAVISAHRSGPTGAFHPMG